MKEIADIIADTREHIEKNGWWRGALVGPNGKQVCTLGGIYISQDWTTDELHQIHLSHVNEIEKFVQAALKGMHPRGLVHHQGEGRGVALPNDLGITAWNDHYAKDKQDVLDTLAKAEKIARTGFDPDAP